MCEACETCEALFELLDRLPRMGQGSVTITVAFPREYWVSFEDGRRRFSPGSGKYDELSVACRHAIACMDEFDRLDSEAS